MTKPRITRRSVLAATAALPLAVRAAENRRYVIVALVGDKLSLVLAQNTTGSHLDRNLRSFAEDGGGAFDRLAVKAIADELARSDSSATVVAVPLAPSKLHDQPELLLRSDGVVLPDAVVDVIEKERATHVLLLTKLVGDATFQLARQPVGVGKLRGVGFYIDGAMRLRNLDNVEQRSVGFLSPFVYVRLSLVDVRTGLVVRASDAKATDVIATYENPKALGPWDVLSNEEKLDALGRMLDQELSRATRELVKSS